MKTDGKGKEYRVPAGLSDFQKRMYMHLIDWKHNVLGEKEAGVYRGRLYDCLFTDQYIQEHPYPALIYAGVLMEYDKMQHEPELAYKVHKYAYHMASSQTACVNLFMPVLMSSEADEILKHLPGAPADFVRIDRDRERLFNGYCFEYWGQDFVSSRSGVLGDHSNGAGTDSDVAIAYINDKGERCLWIIEHKLTEREFTTCGAYRSKANTQKHLCKCNGISDLVADPGKCHYHNIGYKYWEVMKKNSDAFRAEEGAGRCPFIGGMNQLWRNHLLALQYVAGGQYASVTFSVVHHRDNDALNETLAAYRKLIGPDVLFSTFTNEDLVVAAERHSESLGDWAKWYRNLYFYK